jgi:DNA-binding NarL/FixJ family response regulator
MDGVEAIQHLSNGVETKALPVLVLTTFDDDQEVRRALHAGARGYLLKDITPDDLISAVRNLAEGQRDDILLGHSITQRLVKTFLVAGPASVPADPAAGAPWPTLTRRERDVLRAVADGRSNREIAAQLHLSYSTVKTHVSHLLTKLDVRDRAQLVAWAHRSQGISAPTTAEQAPRRDL